MFNFFDKKDFLVDYLEGFTDIHNHILPGIDDGAKTSEDSVRLIRGFMEFGVCDFIFTPHIMHNYYPNTPDTIEQSFQQLSKTIASNNLSTINIGVAAEHMIDDNFEEILERDAIMPLKEHYLLLEMSYLQPSINFKTAIKKVCDKGYIPIFAHPERYIYLRKKDTLYEKYKSLGMDFQLNMLSLSGYYGKDITKITIKLIEAGLINYLASDLHNLRQLNHLKKTVIPKKIKRQLLWIIENTKETFLD